MDMTDKRYEPPGERSLYDRVTDALGSQYALDGEIGRGGMSVVYRARDLRLNRDVAIKVLPPDLAHDPAIRARFTREAQTAAQLAHPHIVPIYDVGERDGIAWLVIVASEMLTGTPGVGGFLWQEYNSLVYAHILLAIITIGVIGFGLDRLMGLAERKLRTA